MVPKIIFSWPTINVAHPSRRRWIIAITLHIVVTDIVYIARLRLSPFKTFLRFAYTIYKIDQNETANTYKNIADNLAQVHSTTCVSFFLSSSCTNLVVSLLFHFFAAYTTVALLIFVTTRKYIDRQLRHVVSNLARESRYFDSRNIRARFYTAVKWRAVTEVASRNSTCELSRVFRDYRRLARKCL